ncbi:MAG: DoxX family protein [Chitinophagaceae bacterium]|nr:DoxX family protein [Chitinophagaceae bacterium]
MKTNAILYWIFTILFAGFMIWSGIPGVQPSEDSVKFMHDYLGYPVYFIRFISIAKIIGGVALLIPWLNKIKEWAYAGMFFDLGGAVFSLVSISGKFEPGTFVIFLPVILGILSYYFWNKIKSSKK